MTSKGTEKETVVPEDISRAFEQLPQLLAKRQRELDEQENAIKKERKALEEERKIYGASKGNDYDVLHLNIGGTRVDVLRGTLTSIKNSVLESQFSGRWDDNLVKDRDGNIFIDHPAEIFLPLIDFLRSKSLETSTGQIEITPEPPPSLWTFDDDQTKFDRFLRVVEYYNITHGLYPFKINQLAAPEETEDEQIPDIYIPGCCEVVSKTFRFIYLRPFQHMARIRAFEVRLGCNVTSFQMGWINPHNYPGSHKSPPYLHELSDSVAINAQNSTTSVLGTNNSIIDGRTIGMEEGTTIRCNRLNYTFQLNGDESLIYPGNYTSGRFYETASDSHVPAMCGIGSWQITRVLFDL